MIQYTRHQLANGLKLIVHPDPETPLVAVCLTYFVGTRDENPERTGFAHLFEHLMFGGSKNAPNFDDIVQLAGGENNAFTNQDMTVYYEVMPRENLEVALWLEADRMANLSLNKKALNVQRKVVVEEFKETCLNEPYGDIWHHIGKLVYQTHPYRVPVIGETFEHIEQASLHDVQDFFQRFYRPNNAILTVCGNVNADEVRALVEKYFGQIEAGEALARKYAPEAAQTEPRRLEVQGNVPLDAIYLCFHGASRTESEYYTEDLISDVLAAGESSWFFQELVQGKKLFVELDAYLTATLDPGLVVIEGKLSEGVTFAQAEAAIWEQLQRLQNAPIDASDWEKLQNRIEHDLHFGENNSFNKAISLGFYELLGDIDRINREAAHYRAATPAAIQARAQQLFQPQCASVIWYKGV